MTGVTPERLDELQRLRRWKAEATPVILGLQDLGRALDVPLGRSITAEIALQRAEQLRTERDDALAALRRVQALADEVTSHPLDYASPTVTVRQIRAALNPTTQETP